MLVIGLTGGIGSGKSTVANLFKELGITIVDTDIIARELVQPGQEALNEIISSFGTSLLQTDGQLDRKQLGQITFSDVRARKQLESILHPRIRQIMLAQLDAATSPYAIAVIPLLFESHQQATVDRVLVVDCDENTQIQRVKKRDQRSAQQIRNIIQAQSSREYRLAHADDVIVNTNDADELQQQVIQLHKKYLQLSASSHASDNSKD
jgi:dephospho-CoA kinase